MAKRARIRDVAAAIALIGQADGPCCPIPGPDSIEFGGTRFALERKHGVDLSKVGDERDRVYEATDRQGLTWFVRRGGVGLQAFRERTTAELIVRRNELEELKCKLIPAFRLQSARLIAIELAAMAEQLAPDTCGTHAGRRRFKKRMAALSMLQWELLAGTQSATVAGAKMQALGL